MEFDNQYASRGKGNAALTTGIIGTAGVGLGLLGNMLNGGIGYNNGHCSDDHYVNRYEAGQAARIAELETEVKLRDSNIYTDQKLNDFRNYVDKNFDKVNDTLCKQAIQNQKTADAFELVRSDIISTKNELYCAINRERDERCCGDNAIVNYSNATFYPKRVADITTEATTTPQTEYNPLPNCNCGGCGCNGYKYH